MGCRVRVSSAYEGMGCRVRVSSAYEGFRVAALCARARALTIDNCDLLHLASAFRDSFCSDVLNQRI